MRRPLNWLVASICLLALFANRMVANSDPAPAAAVPALPAVVTGMSENTAGSPFAYVREDGSEVYLPPRGSTEGRRAVQFEDAAVAITDPAAAVYTWSSPMSDSLGERAFY